MDPKLIAVLVTLGFSVIGVVGDYFLKRASSADNFLDEWSFYVGFALYASTAFGWVYVMRHLKLGTIGAVYSVSIIVMLTTIGVLAFDEKLSGGEIVGLVMAVGSIILLMRFA